MPIKNYTTKIDVYVSLGEIQGALAGHGARKIAIDYNEAGKPNGLTFGIQTPYGPQVFCLPASSEGVAAVLVKQKVKADQEQIERIAWRNVRDWVLAQMAFIEAGNVLTEEVFLPYQVDKTGQTLFQVYRSGQLMLGKGEGI